MNLPKLDGVRESTVIQFLRLAAGNHAITDKNTLPKIVETEGRCIRVHVPGFALDWHALSETLLGACRPCEEFRVEGCFINARLKTDDQRAADDLAFDIDEKYPDALKAKIQTWWPFFNDSAPTEPRTAHQKGQANGKKPERRVPDGLAQDIMKVMARDCRLGTMDIDDLVSVVKKTIPKKLDSEGKDRRSRNIRIAIDKLVHGEFLHLHGDEQDEVGLTNLILETETDDENSDA